MTNDPAWALAEHIIGTGFADLPASTRAATCNDILDTFGCLLGGSGAPGIAELAHVMGGWGGAPQSQVMLRRRLPAPQAAMLNASMAHALDFDDTLDHGGSIHPGASVLAASLATADLRGGVSGERLLLAIALGLDVSCRVALASTLDRGAHIMPCGHCLIICYKSRRTPSSVWKAFQMSAHCYNRSPDEGERREGWRVRLAARLRKVIDQRVTAISAMLCSHS